MIWPDEQTNAPANSACHQEDFPGFFEIFIRSPEARTRYTAPLVRQAAITDARLEKGTRPGSDYARFNITTVDYYYADTASVEAWEKEPESRAYILLELAFMDLPGHRKEVRYRPALFDDEEAGGDGKRVVRYLGPAAAYQFSWADGCWRLDTHLD